MITLSEVAFDGNLIRDGKFRFTLFPATSTPGSLCYAFGGKFFEQAIKNPNISAIITTSDLADLVPQNKGLLISERPDELYYRIHDFLINKLKIKLVTRVNISSSATLHSSVDIRGNVIIEDDVVIESGVIIEPNTIIRKNCYIGNRVILGAKGMQNLKVNGQFIKVAYGGGVEIGANTEILDYAMIQRPYNFLFTTVGEGCKISVRVSIGHGSVIGNNSMIAGNTQLAGNVTIGDNVWIGPSVTIADSISIGNNSKVLIGSVVTTPVNEGQTVSGNFALTHSKQLKHFASIKKKF